MPHLLQLQQADDLLDLRAVGDFLALGQPPVDQSWASPQ
jgi:hypothetical protein